MTVELTDERKKEIKEISSLIGYLNLEEEPMLEIKLSKSALYSKSFLVLYMLHLRGCTSVSINQMAKHIERDRAMTYQILEYFSTIELVKKHISSRRRVNYILTIDTGLLPSDLKRVVQIAKTTIQKKSDVISSSRNVSKNDSEIVSGG